MRKWKNKLLLFTFIFLLTAQTFSHPSFVFAIDHGGNEITHTSKEIGSDDCLREYEVTAQFKKEDVQKPTDLIFVQDASGSFRDTIGNVKKALNEVIDYLIPGDRVQLTTYRGAIGNSTANGKKQNMPGWDYEVKTNQPLTNNFVQAKNAVNSFVVNSGTPTASGLKSALESYEANKGDISNRSTVFVLITDGVANTRLDGYLKQRDDHFSMRTPKGANSVEYNQDYKAAIQEVIAQTNNIKAKGYELITGYWEQYQQFQQSGQLEDRYDGPLVNPDRDGKDYPVRPDVINSLKGMASSHDNFIEASTKDGDNINEFTRKLKEVIARQIQVSDYKVMFNVDERYTIDESSVQLISDQVSADPVIEGNRITFDLGNIPAGEYVIKYKITQNESIAEQHTASEGQLIINGEINVFPPIIHEANNENCFIEPSDPAIDKDVNGKDHLSIDREKEYVYNITTPIPNNIKEYTKFVITDEVDPGLTVLKDKVKVTVDGKTYDGLKLTIDGNNVKVEVTDFAGLSGKEKIQLVIPAMINVETDISQYKDNKIPNTANLHFKNAAGKEDSLKTDPVTVTPPKDLKIDKDVNEKDHIIMDRKKEYVYNVTTTIPNDMKEYTKLVITDEVDSGLTVLKDKVKVTVNGEAYDGLKLIVDGNNVKVEVTDFAGLSGKEKIQLVIPAMINANTDISKYKDNKIPNTANIDFENISGQQNNKKSSTVTVTPADHPGKPNKPSGLGGLGDPGEPNKPNEPGKWIDKLPQTGEELLLYMTIFGFLLLVIGGVLLFYRERNME
ncbi:isopeptide-forming domain-containing fimbrial protein [Bacillus aquiflavi]|uniref:Isopeptide-forming domain-containing fimbrial protein n=1 Tax=Bacillus aquiflavi TaxID=2672567 RepID=A0A6B3W3F3_9BACI|nr:isopeptide-forming domain-containing fimbrial protein [Bacillus aquiflavi]MBA4538667.1 isopeptide-forming domain-containing fimbrial protein [Bacillus aquiflavi]NEY83027.1 isopeptide-forming domain-containing fimbrial protein [Bacillus aquiflavi]